MNCFTKHVTAIALALVCLLQASTVSFAKEPVQNDTETEGCYIFQESKKVGELPRVFLKQKTLEQYTAEIGALYNLPPELLQAIAERESSLDILATNGKCCGLMQVSTKWHCDRMEKLGVENIYTPYDNIMVAADYLSELLQDNNNDLGLVLMIYNGTSNAKKYSEKGELTLYAKGIIDRMNDLISEHQETGEDIP